jgi:CAAX prenyl protease-like protein
MEEIFWRSFMLRYVITSDFTSVRIGTFTLTSFLICAVLFGLEHNLLLAGIMAGAVYSLLLYWTKSIFQCVLAHAVTNLALGLYVLQTGHWQFW